MSGDQPLLLDFGALAARQVLACRIEMVRDEPLGGSHPVIVLPGGGSGVIAS